MMKVTNHHSKERRSGPRVFQKVTLARLSTVSQCPDLWFREAEWDGDEPPQDVEDDRMRTWALSLVGFVECPREQ